MDATVKAAFWSDPRVEELNAEGKLAALWLITNSQRDLLGFTRSTTRRFTFETGLEAEHLEAPCKALPSSFQAPSEGVFFSVNFLRHQFGQGGEISLRNKVIQSAIKKAKTLPCPLQGAFLKAYPELVEAVLGDPGEAAAAEAPCKPLAACPRPDLTIKAIAAALKCIIRHRGAIDFDEILEAVKANADAVKAWPEDERIAYTPEATTYFEQDLWRKAPESWQSRRQARKTATDPVRPTLSNTGTGRTFKLLE
jgi:hypothetical protein